MGRTPRGNYNYNYNTNWKDIGAYWGGVQPTTESDECLEVEQGESPSEG